MQNNIKFLDKEGYEAHLRSIKGLKENLKKIEKRMNELQKGNFDKEVYEELVFLKEEITNRIFEKESEKVQIVENSNNDDILDIGDRVKVKLYFTDTDYIENELTLIARDNNDNSRLDLAPINSPIGKALYKHKVGDIGSYLVNGNKVKVEILEKINAKKLVKTN